MEYHIKAHKRISPKCYAAALEPFSIVMSGSMRNRNIISLSCDHQILLPYEEKQKTFSKKEKSGNFRSQFESKRYKKPSLRAKEWEFQVTVRLKNKLRTSISARSEIRG